VRGEDPAVDRADVPPSEKVSRRRASPSAAPSRNSRARRDANAMMPTRSVMNGRNSRLTPRKLLWRRALELRPQAVLACDLGDDSRSVARDPPTALAGQTCATLRTAESRVEQTPLGGSREEGTMATPRAAHSREFDTIAGWGGILAAIAVGYRSHSSCSRTTGSAPSSCCSHAVLEPRHRRRVRTTEGGRLGLALWVLLGFASGIGASIHGAYDCAVAQQPVDSGTPQFR
jgi:hypothetical protein